MKNQTRAMFMGGLVVLFWSTVATAFKIALDGMSFVTLLLIASLTALAVTFAEILRLGKIGELISFFKKRENLVKAALQGLLNPFLYYLVLFKAYALLPAQIAQPLNYSWQIVLLLMISIRFRRRLKWYQSIGIAVSFAGIAILSGNNSASPDGALSLVGVILALGSTFIWATYWLSKINSKEDSTISLFTNFLFGSLYIVIPALFIPMELPALKPFLAAVYVGCFEMGFAFILWGKALNLAKNKLTLTQITYLSPVLSLIFIHFVLGEKIGVFTVMALILIISGIFISNLKKQSDF
ncbi:MAG: DMT family transporter [Bacteroidales bacterium]|nr:DMT family transporter [Bacteroidales bacterium]